MKLKFKITTLLLSSLMFMSCAQGNASRTINIDISVAQDTTVAVLAAIEQIEAGKLSPIVARSKRRATLLGSFPESFNSIIAANYGARHSTPA